MIRKHYSSEATGAACLLAECSHCILNYLVEVCPFRCVAPAQILLDVNLAKEDPDA